MPFDVLHVYVFYVAIDLAPAALVPEDAVTTGAILEWLCHHGPAQPEILQFYH